MFRNGFWEHFHHLPRDWDKVDCFVVPQILLLVLLEDRNGTYFPGLQDVSKATERDLTMTSADSLRTWCNLSDPCNCVYSVCLSSPWPCSPPPWVSLPCSALSVLRGMQFLKICLTGKDWSKEDIEYFVLFLVSYHQGALPHLVAGLHFS